MCGRSFLVEFDGQVVEVAYMGTLKICDTEMVWRLSKASRHRAFVSLNVKKYSN